MIIKITKAQFNLKTALPLYTYLKSMQGFNSWWAGTEML